MTVTSNATNDRNLGPDAFYVENPLLLGSGSSSSSAHGQELSASLLTTNGVADLMSACSNIGLARAALDGAGFRTAIAGNRISIDDRVFVQYLGGLAGGGTARWMVYSADECMSVWAEADSGPTRDV